MDGISLFTFCALVGIAIHNAFWTVLIIRVLRNRRSVDVPDEELPKAAVLLCLRGADPTLRTCLQRLLRQDYPDYELFICVDSRTDPAWKIVQDTLRETRADHVHVSALRERLSTCSLKCSSLVQLVDQLDESHEVIVLADADLESHATWLRELVVPLASPKIGATFGNRWFVPSNGSLGSLVRQLWNAPGLAVMHAIEIPWAGSLAIRSDVFRRSGLRDLWAHSIVDDGPVRTAVKKQNLRLQFVPSVTMPNREECELGCAYNFVRRQMTWTRTYVPTWWAALLIYSCLCVMLWTGASVLAMVCAFQGSTQSALLFGSGALVMGAGVFVSWMAIDISARRVVRAQGEWTPSVWSFQLLQIPVAMFVAAWVHVYAAIAATICRRVTWRGVVYEIRGPYDVRMIDDRQIAIPTGQAHVETAALPLVASNAVLRGLPERRRSTEPLSLEPVSN
jgi:hypothetical protein